jgi:hypothetical protein
LRFSVSGLPMMTSGAPLDVWNRQRREDEGADDARLQADARELQVAPAQGVEGAERGQDEGARHGRPAHVVEVLPGQPRVRQQSPQRVQLRAPVLDGVRHRVLHPGVGGDDEEAGDPRADEDHERRDPVQPRSDTSATGEEQANEHRLGKEGEDTLQGQGLSDHAAGVVGESGPVGAELELQRDAGHDPDGEVHREDLGPEVCGAVVGVALGERLAQRAQASALASEVRDGLHPREEERQTHREDGEQVVERDRQRELEPIHGDVAAHAPRR